MAEIFIQFDAGRRLLACGLFPLPGLVGLKPGQAGAVFTALILDAPAGTDPCRAAGLFLKTKIEPLCFRVDFAALGPGREIIGKAITLTEAAAMAGRPRNTLLSAVRRGDLPTFKDPAERPGGGQRGHMVNSLDLDRYIENPGRPHGRPRKPQTPPPAPKKRGRPPKKKPG
jgi:hypothetical protein